MISKLIEQEIDAFHIIDIGCRGELNPKWKPIEHKVNLHGFDPDQEECERLSRKSNNFKSVTYHSFAVAGHSGTATLYKTRSGACYSLLKPDTEWLARFSFHELFDILGEEQLTVRDLSHIEALTGLDIDILKIDSQGLELEILKGAEELVEKSFYVETESGFTPNYIHESTQAQVDEYMRSKGFLLFDLVLSRMTHDNIFKDVNKHHSMLLWSESIWLKDFISMFKMNQLKPGENIDRKKSVKALTICAIQGCIDYGYELAKIFNELGLLSNLELASLGKESAWRLFNSSEIKSQSKYLNFILRCLPTSLRNKIRVEAELASKQTHIFKRTKNGQ